MKRQRNLNRTVFLLFAVLIFTASAFVAKAQDASKFKIGDHIECDGTGNKTYWVKGVVIPFKGDDMFNGNTPDSGYFYRVKLDGRDAEGTLCKAQDMRLVAAPKPTKSQNDNRASNNKTPKTDDSNNDDENQPTIGEFKVGDRVETLVGGKWYPATVTRGLENNSYGVVQDRFVGTGVYNENIKPYDTPTPQEIRALQDGSKAPVAPAAQAKREPIKCPEQSNAKSGAPPSALVKKLIQCLWEEQSDDIHTINFDLHSAQIGTPRPWRSSWSGGDMGTGIPGETPVYPVKGTWTKRIYSSSGVIITEEEGVHNCYINAFHKWQCGLATSKELKPMQSISNP